MSNIRTMASSGSSTEPPKFHGSSRTINGDSSKLMTEPLADDEKFVLDLHAPHMVPKEKTVFQMKWNYHPKGADNSLELGTIGFLDMIKNMKWKNGAIIDSEIHVIYLPNLPVEIFRSHMIEIGLTFEGTEGDEKLMSKAVFPSSLHTHVIFYPGHSFSVSRGSKFPWKLKIETSADISEDYKIAQVIVSFKGYNTPLSQFSDKNGADIISLVPSSEVPTGITLTRPRGDIDWKVKGVRFGVRSKKDMNAITLLQESMEDVEALHNCGMLKDAILAVNKIVGNVTESTLSTQTHQAIRNAVHKIIVSKNK